MMRALIVLACVLLSGCLAQQPRPCKSPPLLSGALSVSTQNEKLWAYARYQYDELGQRMRLTEMGTYQNKSFTYDALLLFRQSVLYEIDTQAKLCKKKPLKIDFHPMEIPKDSQLLAQVVLGGSSGPGQGLLINTWWGEMPNKQGKCMSSVTEFGCIPVSMSCHTTQFGWMMTSFFNNVIGISDPGQLNPPDFCRQEEQRDVSHEEPTDFFSLFKNL